MLKIHTTVYSISKTSPILEFSLFLEILKADRMHHHAKFSQNRSNGCGDNVVFNYFKMATICHLG